jgi:hypothetical protein
MRNKKLMPIPMLLVFALVTVGFAYAHWSQTLIIEGSVESGEVDWEFVGASCSDTSGNDYNCRDGFAGPYPLFWQVDKDVGSTSVEIINPHTVALTLTNVYPSYYTSVSVYAHNTGTIPLIFDKVIIKDDITVEIRDDPTPIVKLDLNGDGKKDIEIWWLNGFGEQREPCEMFPELSFWIHILQDAPQGATLTFTIELVAIQWNMYLPPP